MTLLLGALIIGLILSLLAFGVFISFRIFHFPDITADGSITLGASVSAVLLLQHINPISATLAAGVCGALAGMTTGILHTRFKINGLLAGILVMTALYSANLHVMGQSNLPLLSTKTLVTYAEDAGMRLFGTKMDLNILGWNVAARDASVLIFCFIFVAFVGFLLYLFFRTHIGTAMRATGDNDQMIRAMGASTGTMQVFGLALSNGLIAVSGSLLSQFQGFADLQMGIGMIVWGLASVIIGTALVASDQLGLTIAGAVMGSVLFRLLIAIALRCGLNPTDLKIVTALFVFAALVFPKVLQSVSKGKSIHAQS
jgi:putative tryptophan/tyrosine transport system permease protein